MKRIRRLSSLQVEVPRDEIEAEWLRLRQDSSDADAEMDALSRHMGAAQAMLEAWQMDALTRNNNLKTYTQEEIEALRREESPTVALPNKR